MSAAKKIPPVQSGVISHLESVELSSSDFRYFAEKIYSLAGVSLPENEKNRALMKNRLARLMRKHNVNDYSSLRAVLVEAKHDLDNEFISALTTNKTDFYREKAHFDFLAKQLKGHFDKNDELRIWCSAASTGQEPYTLAMVCMENLNPSELMRTKILATDIDLQVLDKAASGKYSKFEMSGMPPHLEKKYFQPVGKDLFAIDQSLVDMISFCPFNLAKGPGSFRAPFHHIFCRNVLIYFDDPTCQQVINGLLSSLIPGGYLFLGHSEAGVMRSPGVESLSSAIYRKLGK